MKRKLALTFWLSHKPSLVGHLVQVLRVTLVIPRLHTAHIPHSYVHGAFGPHTDVRVAQTAVTVPCAGNASRSGS